MTMTTFFIIWFLLLIISLIGFKITEKHRTKIKKQIVDLYDLFIYDYTLKILRNKENFYSWDKALDIIFKNHIDFIKNKDYSTNSLKNFNNKFMLDISYTEDLLSQDNLFDSNLISNSNKLISGSSFVYTMNKAFFYSTCLFSLFMFLIYKKYKKI
ncbi:hypothetical protein VAMP_125n103 [Candidatus Vampirococcus lugosii]|uniref:Uncharacterized protein n=2 Tax=Candidatus Vampirococcus lugosii TaxID=2789015 RepID=A0ABS5QLU1_9BACT|nr:hypothetical protein [Candidatus Vampirococcus lugosii]